MNNTKGYIIKPYKHRFSYQLTSIANSVVETCNRLIDGEIRIGDYRSFLQDVEAYKKLNEIYLHVARLKKPSFFVLHHDFRGKPEKMLEIAELEYSLGWRSTFFVPDNPDLLNKDIGRELWSMNHDLGVIYDCVDRATAEGIGRSETEIKRRAWFMFQDLMTRNMELAINCVTPRIRPFGADNTILWRDNNFHLMHIRCETEMDLRNEDIVCFSVKGSRVRYQMRLKGGGYRDLRPDLTIDGIRDLGRKLKSGYKVSRLIVRMQW